MKKSVRLTVNSFLLTLLVIVLLWVSCVFYAGKKYTPARFHAHCHPANPFCGLKIVPISIPGPIQKEVMKKMKEYQAESIHASFGKYRRGRTFPSHFVQKHLGSLVRFAQQLPPTISKILGHDVELTDVSQPTTLSILQYEGNGEGIDWHYDSNHFQGRFFTLIIPVQNHGTGRFQYRDGHGHIKTVGAMDSVLFEGSDVFHRGSPNDKGERIVISLQFVSVGGGVSAWWQTWNRWIKDRAFLTYQLV